MKLTLEEVDEHYSEYGDCDDYYWDHDGPEPIANINRVRRIISKDLEIHEDNIRITWCAPVSEYCLYINGEWSDYVDFDEEYDNCRLTSEHLDNYDYYKNNR